MGQSFISYERDQNWRGKYILLIEKKIIGEKKNVYPFQRKDGYKGQTQMFTCNLGVQKILKTC